MILPPSKFKVISFGNKTEKHNTLMCDVEDKKGNLYPNVICNTALQKYIDAYQDKTEFTIISIEKQMIKSKEKTRRNTLKEVDKEITKVGIKCHNLDYSQV